MSPKLSTALSPEPIVAYFSPLTVCGLIVEKSRR